MDNNYVLGQRALQNFYIVFDYDNNKIGFGGGKTIDGLPSKKFPTWAIILIATGIVGVLLAIGICIFIKIRNKRLQGRLDQYNEVADREVVQ